MGTTSKSMSDAIETLYTKIENTRMDGVPILNKKLNVAALGFEPYSEYALGILVTPWFMNLMLVPLDHEKFTQTAPEQGAKRTIILPAGEVEFILSFEEGFGWLLACSLFSPMFEFEDQVAVLETAKTALVEILNENAQLDMPEQDMQDVWEGKLPELEGEAEIAQASELDTPPKNIDRRSFLRGNVRENTQKNPQNEEKSA